MPVTKALRFSAPYGGPTAYLTANVDAIHDMSTNSGFCMSFLLRLTPPNPNEKPRQPGLVQSIYCSVVGTSDDGHNWGLEFSIPFTNKGCHPLYKAADSTADFFSPPGKTTVERENYFSYQDSWQFTSLKYMKIDNNSTSIDKVRAESWAYMSYKAMDSQDQTIAQHTVELMQADNDFLGTAFNKDNIDQYPNICLPIFNDGESFVQVTLHVSGDSNDTFLTINGMRQMAKYGADPVFWAKVPPTGTGQKNTVQMQLFTVVDQSDYTYGYDDVVFPYRTYIDLANIWVGFLELDAVNRENFLNTMYDKETGIPNHIGDGTIPNPQTDGEHAQENRFIKPIMYLTGENGLINNVDGKDIAVMQSQNIEIIDVPNIGTFLSGARDKLIMRCKTYPYPAEWDKDTWNKYYSEYADSRLVRTKFSALYLDDNRDYSKFYFCCWALGNFYLTIYNRGSSLPLTTHISVKQEKIAGQKRRLLLEGCMQNKNGGRVFDGTGVGVPSYSNSEGGWLFHQFYIDFNDPDTCFWHVTDDVMRYDTRLGSSVSSSWSSEYKPVIYKMDAPLQFNYAVLGMSERNVSAPPDPVSDNDIDGTHSTRLLNPVLYSGSVIDTYPELPWKSDMSSLFSYMNGGVMTAKDLGPNGRGDMIVRPDLYCEAKNGLGIFGNAANGTMALATLYADESYADGRRAMNQAIIPMAELLSSAPFVEKPEMAD